MHVNVVGFSSLADNPKFNFKNTLLHLTINLCKYDIIVFFLNSAWVENHRAPTLYKYSWQVSLDMILLWRV